MGIIPSTHFETLRLALQMRPWWFCWFLNSDQRIGAGGEQRADLTWVFDPQNPFWKREWIRDAMKFAKNHEHYSTVETAQLFLSVMSLYCNSSVTKSQTFRFFLESWQLPFSPEERLGFVLCSPGSWLSFWLLAPLQELME